MTYILLLWESNVNADWGIPKHRALTVLRQDLRDSTLSYISCPWLLGEVISSSVLFKRLNTNDENDLQENIFKLRLMEELGEM